MKINAGQASSTLIPEYIGSAFDKVITVADNIDHIKEIAEGIEGISVTGHIGDTPPTQPTAGAIWYCTLDGRSYVWYEDADTGQWVEDSPQSTADDPHLAGNIFTLWKRSVADAGYNLVVGSFETGGTLSSTADVLLHNATAAVYAWAGTFPHVVPPATDPTAVGSGYISHTDVVLRTALAAPNSEVLIADVPANSVAKLRTELAQGGSTVSVAGVSAAVVATAATACVYAENYPTLADAIATGKNVLYSNSYTITSPITLLPNQRITKIGNGVITFTGMNAFTLASGNTLEYCEFTGPNNVPALRASGGIKDIKIIHPKCNICPLLRTNTALAYADADWVGKTNIVQNVTVINPIGYGDSSIGAVNTFMQTHYIDGFTVIGGYCENYYFGHYYWGGDSAFNKDGIKANTRKCDNINLIGFRTKDAYFCGLWGSMAQNVKRVNCSVVRSTVGGDVGIDDEGTVSAINTNCHAEGYANGNFTGFYGFSDLQLIGCTSRQYANYPHYRNYNSAGTSPSSGNVVIDGGSWVTIDPENGFARIDTNNGPAKSFTITSSTVLENTKINLYTSNGDINLSGLNMRFSVAGTALFVAVYLSVYNGGVTTVEDVVITNDVAPFSGSNGIHVNTRSTASNDNLVIRGNNAPLMNITLEDMSANATYSGNVFCYDNIVSSIVKLNTGGGKALTIVRGDNNYTPAGAAITV